MNLNVQLLTRYQLHLLFDDGYIHSVCFIIENLPLPVLLIGMYVEIIPKPQQQKLCKM